MNSSMYLSSCCVAAALCLAAITANASLAQENDDGQSAAALPARDRKASDLADSSAPKQPQLIDPAGRATNPTFSLPRAQHAWVRFASGAWRTIRVTTLATPTGADAPLESSAVQTEVLKSASDDHYVIEVQATVETGGKTIVGQWRERRLHLLVDRTASSLAHRRLGDASVAVNFTDVPCNVWELSYVHDSQSMVDRIFYNSEVPPYVLRRESIEQGGMEDRPHSVERTEYIAIQLPYVVNDDALMCDCRRRYTSGVKGRTVEIAFVSNEIPGGEAAAWSTEWDAEGKRVRTTRTELVDYGDHWDDDLQDVQRRRLLPRRQRRVERRRNRDESGGE